jgi:copper(I)-binding protein
MNIRIIAIAILLIGSPAGLLLAHDYEIGAVKITHPWARATAGSSPNGAAYMMLSVEGTESDRLMAVATPAAKHAALHTHVMEDGVMKMRPVDAIEVAPGSPTVLQPGGLHIMLMDLAAPLKEGDTVKMTLTFENAGSVEIEAVVQKAGATQPMHHGAQSGS